MMIPIPWETINRAYQSALSGAKSHLWANGYRKQKLPEISVMVLDIGGGKISIGISFAEPNNMVHR